MCLICCPIPKDKGTGTMSTTLPAKRTAEGEEKVSSPMCSNDSKPIERFNLNPRYCSVLKAGNMVYFAGLVADDLTKDAKDQTIQILSKADALMSEHNLTKTNILSASIWLKDIQADFSKLNGAWEAWMDSENPPVRAAVQGALMTSDHLVEIQFTFQTSDQQIERFEKGLLYSLIAKSAGVTYFAGMIADDLSLDSKGQTEQILAKAQDLMNNYDLKKSDIIAATIWLKDIQADFGNLNEVWESWVDQENLPVRATVGSALLSEAHLVEIQFTFQPPTEQIPIERFSPNGRYCSVVKAGEKTYFAGLVADDLSQDALGQVQQVLEKADKLMTEHNLAKQSMISSTVWLKNMAEDFGTLNSVWEGWIDSENPPVRASVEGGLMTEAHLVEIQLTFFEA